MRIKWIGKASSDLVRLHEHLQMMQTLAPIRFQLSERDLLTTHSHNSEDKM